MTHCCGHPERPNDEHYTPYETAEYLLNKYGYLMKGKKVILPCDTEQSELYKACLRHGIDCDIAQDMYNVDYTKYDLVFTNPPFSKARKLIRFYNENNIKFILFVGWATALYLAVNNKAYYVEDFICSRYVDFILPDGSTKLVHWALVSNLEETREIVEAKPDIRIKPTNEWQHYRGIFYDFIRCNYLAYDWCYKSAALKPKERLRLKRSEEDER